MPIPVKIRPVQSGDADACARIVYQAFQDVSERHGFEFQSTKEEIRESIKSKIKHPKYYGIIAEAEDRIIGCNFLDERDEIRGVGPITIDPSFQGQGVGRLLMQKVIARAKGARSVRLLQDSFNMSSLSLYASLGFNVKEPIILVKGKPKSQPKGDLDIRQLKVKDVESCAALCKKVHGFERTNELRDAVKELKPYVACRTDRITAYITTRTSSYRSHGVAESEEDMKELILGMSSFQQGPITFLVPARDGSLYPWCIQEGLRAVKPMTLMALGEYDEPKGSWFPSILY